MFNNLNHRFGERGKRAAALLAAAVQLCGLTGCSKSETDSSVPDIAASVLQSTSVTETKDSQSSEVNSDSSGSSDAQNEQNATPLIKPEIVMDDHLIILPCKVKEIEGITIDREYSFAVVPAKDNVDEYSTAYFYYKQKRVGLIRLDGDCSKKPDLDEETVLGIDLFDDIPFSYLGLTPQSNKDDVIRILGNPNRGGNTLLVYYINENPADHISFDLNSNDKLIAVRIQLGLA